MTSARTFEEMVGAAVKMRRVAVREGKAQPTEFPCSQEERLILLSAPWNDMTRMLFTPERDMFCGMKLRADSG